MAKQVYTATQARANFFRLLDQAEAGEDIVIVKLDDRTTFRVARIQGTKADKRAILHRMAKLGFRSRQPAEMRRVLVHGTIPEETNE